MLDQMFNRRLAIVQADEIKERKDARIRDRAQFGIGKSSAHRNPRLRMVLFDPLRHPKGSIKISGKRNRHQHQVKIPGRKMCRQPLIQQQIGKRGWRFKGQGKLVKCIGRPPESFGIAAKPKMRIDRFHDEIGEVFEKEGRQMLGPVSIAHAAKGPLQISFHLETRGLRKVTSLADLQGERGIFSLKEPDYRIDDPAIILSHAINPHGVA